MGSQYKIVELMSSKHPSCWTFAIVNIMKPRFIFIHGNQALSWDFSFAGWLKQELISLGFEVRFETFPDSIIGRKNYWFEFMEEYLKVGENDIIIGWSTGAIAAMKYAESHKIKGSILISPYYTDLGDDLERQSGYFDSPWQWDRIISNQGKIAVIYGDDDPYIPQDEFEFVGDKLNATKIKVVKGEHFIECKEIPGLLGYIKANYQS